MTQGDVPVPAATAGPITPERADGTRMGVRARLSRHFRLEDLLLFAWLVVQPILFAPSRTSSVDGVDLLAGILDLAGLCGLGVCLIGRTRPDVRSGLVSGNDFAYAVGPLFGAIAFLLDDTVARLGLDGDLGLVPIVLAVVAGLVARFRFPPLSAEQRRLFVAPFVFAASGFFYKFAGGIADLFDLRTLPDVLAAPSLSGELFLVFGLATLGILVFYLMFVFAPSQIAQREGTVWTWAARFALFLLGLAIGATVRGH